MAADSVQFLIDLQARFQTLTPAQSALSNLEKQINKERVALDALEKKLAKATPKQASDLLKQVDAQRKNIGQLERAVPAWRKFADASKSTSKATDAMQELGTAAGGTLGRLSSVASVAGTAAGAIGILTGVVIALAAAVVYGAVSLVRFALASADAARSSYLLSAAAAGSAPGGAELEASMSQLARRVPLARAKIADMARGLEDVRLHGRAAQAALTAMTITASARGGAAAGAIKSIAETSKNARRFLLGVRNIYGEYSALAGTGIKSADIYQALAESMKVSIPEAAALLQSGRVSVKQGMIALEKATQARFGDTIAGQMLAMSTQAEKARENFKALFEGVHLDNFLKGMSMVTSLISQDTFTGYALKQVLTGAMNDFFNGAAKVFPYVRAGLIGVAIGALTVYLAFLKARKAVLSLVDKLGLKGALGGIDGITVAMYLGIGAVGFLVGMFALLTVTIGLALVPLAILAAAILIAVAVPIAIVYGLAKAFEWLTGKLAGVTNGLDAVDLYTKGRAYVDGLIKGLLSKLPSVTDAAIAIADALSGGLAGKLIIRSPSKLAFTQGAYYGQGIAMGADSQADAARQAGGRVAGALASGGASVNAGDAGKRELHVHIHGDVYGIDEFNRRVREATDVYVMHEAAATT